LKPEGKIKVGLCSSSKEIKPLFKGDITGRESVRTRELTESGSIDCYAR